MACPAKLRLDSSSDTQSEASLDRDSMPQRSTTRGTDGQAARKKQRNGGRKVGFSGFDLHGTDNSLGTDQRHVCETCMQRTLNPFGKQGHEDTKWIDEPCSKCGTIVYCRNAEGPIQSMTAWVEARGSSSVGKVGSPNGSTDPKKLSADCIAAIRSAAALMSDSDISLSKHYVVVVEPGIFKGGAIEDAVSPFALELISPQRVNELLCVNTNPEKYASRMRLPSDEPEVRINPADPRTHVAYDKFDFQPPRLGISQMAIIPPRVDWKYAKSSQKPKNSSAHVDATSSQSPEGKDRSHDEIMPSAPALTESSAKKPKKSPGAPDAAKLYDDFKPADE